MFLPNSRFSTIFCRIAAVIRLKVMSWNYWHYFAGTLGKQDGSQAVAAGD